MSTDISGTLRSRLADSGNIVVFTGAGMSAESGVPTFRGNDGIWKKFNPQELANIDAFLRNRSLVWEWYNARRKVIAEVKPNAGHYALVDLERIVDTLTIVTQNVDNLHRRAGSAHVLELHGNIERSYCMECRTEYPNLEVFQREGAPECTACGGIIRPDVVWFGEMLPVDVWERAIRAAEQADVLFSVGTSGVVYPAAEIPLRARASGSYVVEVNVEPTEMSERVDELILGPATTVLPQISKLVRQVSAGRSQKKPPEVPPAVTSNN